MIVYSLLLLAQLTIGGCPKPPDGVTYPVQCVGGEVKMPEPNAIELPSPALCLEMSIDGVYFAVPCGKELTLRPMRSYRLDWLEPESYTESVMLELSLRIAKLESQIAYLSAVLSSRSKP